MGEVVEEEVVGAACLLGCLDKREDHPLTQCKYYRVWVSVEQEVLESKPNVLKLCSRKFAKQQPQSENARESRGRDTAFSHTTAQKCLVRIPQ